VEDHPWWRIIEKEKGSVEQKHVSKHPDIQLAFHILGSNQDLICQLPDGLFSLDELMP
jgi:hypothetical protein